MSDIKTFWEQYYQNNESYQIDDFPFYFYSRDHNVVWNRVERYIEPGMNVLDIGIGAEGYYEHALKERCDVTGIDICDNIYKDLHVKSVICDMRTLCFKDESFDVVLCITTLQYIAENEGRIKALSEFHRVLKKKGHMIVVVPTKYSLFGISRQLIKLAGKYQWCPVFRDFPPFELKRIIDGMDNAAIKEYRGVGIYFITGILLKKFALPGKRIIIKLLERVETAVPSLCSLLLGWHIVCVVQKTD